MAIASTSTWVLNRDQIIKDALAMVGAVGPDGTPTAPQTNHAARVLNGIVKSLDSEGQRLWKIVRRTIPTVAGTASYTLGTDVVDVDEPLSYMDAGTTSRTMVRAFSRDDYMQLGDRTVQGRPSHFFTEFTLQNTVTVTFWPVPEATADTIEYSARVRALDFTDGSNNPDFPQSWTDMLIVGLASRLAYTYKQPQLAAQLRIEYEAAKLKLIQDDTERGNLTLVPFGSWG